MDSRDKLEKIEKYVFAFFLTFFLWHNLQTSGNNIIFIFIFIISYYFCNVALIKIKCMEKRKIKIIVILSAFFSIIELVGKSIDKDYTLRNILNKWILIDLFGYFFIMFSLTGTIFNFLENSKKIVIFIDKIKITKFLKNKKCIFCVFFLCIFLAWLPIFFRYYPGITTPDSCSQIEQIIGRESLSNHHPITHTAIVGIFVKFGLLISNDINIGVAFYSIASMIIMALLDSYVLMYMLNEKKDCRIILVTLLFYMFYPINSIYSITMWKDVLFSGFIPILLICNENLVCNTEEFLKKKRNVFFYIAVSILIILLRHNGLYMIILTLPFLFVCLKKYRRKLLPIFFSIILLYELSNIIFYNILNVQKGSVAEMLSIPTQQIARAEKEHRKEINEKTRKEIESFLGENIGEKYIPTLSDDVKGSLNVNYYQEHKSKFIKLWLKLLIKYPRTYIEAFISNSYGYYYVEAKNWVISTNTMDRNMGLRQMPIIKIKLIDKFIQVADNRNIAISSMFFSVGFAIWIIVILFAYKIYKKEYQYCLVYCPLAILCLTLIASPVFCEYRYAYAMFLCIPLLFSMNYKINNK